MSLNIDVYCKTLSKALIAPLLERMNEFDMVVEVHPDFKFDQEEDTGFLPFKFQFKETPFEVLKGKTLLSGCEVYVGDFDLRETKELLKPQPSFFQKLLGKKMPEVEFASPEIEQKLKDCKKVISFVWHAGDSFELRFASLTSAILSELTNGVCTYPADDIWYDNKNIVAEAYAEIKAYEQSLRESELNYMEFKKWE